jgi:hypothetical protein
VVPQPSERVQFRGKERANMMLSRGGIAVMIFTHVSGVRREEGLSVIDDYRKVKRIVSLFVVFIRGR